MRSFAISSARRTTRKPDSRQLVFETLERRATPAVYLVNSLAETVSAGNDPAEFTLPEAIGAANANSGADVIEFDAALFADGLQKWIYLNAPLPTVTGSLSIQGPGVERLLLHRPDIGSKHRILTFDDAASGLQTVSVSDLAISGGVADQGAGALFPQNRGGAIYSTEDLTLENVLIVDNSSREFGGAIYNDQGTLTIRNSVVARNSTLGSGSGIYNQGAATIENSTIADNTAALRGGGLDGNGTVSVRDSTFSGNRAVEAGGGLNNNSGTVDIVNSTFSANNAAFGSNILSFGTLNLLNTTLVGGSGTGTGIWTGPSASTTLHNTLISGTLAGANVQPASSHNLVSGTSSAGLTHGFNGNQVGINPAIGPLQFNGGLVMTHALLSGSPAVDAGDGSFIPAGKSSDARDVPLIARIAGATVDIGAFERQSFNDSLVVDTAQDERDGDYNSGDLSLREAIELANGLADENTVVFHPDLTDQTLILKQATVEISDALQVLGPGITIARAATGTQSLFSLLGIRAGVQVELNGLSFTNGWGRQRIIASPFSYPILIEYEEATPVPMPGPEDPVEWSFHGGAVYSQGDLLVLNCLFEENIASNIFEGAGYGGAIYSAGALTVRQSTFHANGAQVGGAIAISDTGTANITASTFYENEAGDGGAIENRGNLLVANSTLVGNAASFQGGAIANFKDARLINVTIVGNRADAAELGGEAGGGVWTYNEPAVNRPDGSTTLVNTLVAGNVRGTGQQASDLDGFPVQAASAFNLIGDPATAGGLVHGQNQNILGKGNGAARVLLPVTEVVDLPLQVLGGSTAVLPLLVGSPALDAGSGDVATANGQLGGEPLWADQRLAPRLAGVNVDIGAFEVSPTLYFAAAPQLLENQQNASVGTVLIANSGTGSAFSYSASDSRFEIAAGVLQLKLDQAVRLIDGNIGLWLTATDQHEAAFQQLVTINVVANPFPWHNSAIPEDANGDGLRDLDDALFVIRKLRRGQGGALPAARLAPANGGHWGDVASNNALDVQDAVAIIRYLRRNRAVAGEGESSPVPTSANSQSPSSDDHFRDGDLLIDLMAIEQANTKRRQRSL